MQDIATKVEGSQLTAEEFNQIPSELENVITSTGQELTSADVRQLAKALAIYASRGDFYTATGTANNIILYPIGNMLCPTSYSIGLKVRFIPTVDNSGNVTLSIKDLPVVNLYDNEGNNLSSGYLVANQVYTATFDGTNFKLSEIPIDLVRRLVDSKQDISTAVTHISNTAVGSGINPVFVAANGTATASTSTVGSTSQPVYLESGQITACTVDTVHVVVETYVNGSSWYRIYDDGWVEQGGIIEQLPDTWTIEFLKPFADSSYMLQGEQWGTDATGNLGILTQSGTSASGNHTGSGTIKVTWYACGQGV